MINENSKIAIIGDNNFAETIINKLINDKIYNITCIITNNFESSKFKNIPMINIEKIKKYYNTLFDEILVLDDMPYKSEFYYDLYKAGIENVSIMIKESEELFEGNKISKKCLQTYNLQGKPVLKYVEMHITDVCNLRCKGCTHFANLFKENEISFESFCNDIDTLSQNFNIPVIRLMGGEPLLNKDLSKYLTYTRSKFPLSKIFLVSNGLLIPTMSDQLCNCLNKEKITINITVYKPTHEIIEKIDKFLNNKKIEHYYGQGHRNYSTKDIISQFHTCLTINNEREINNSGFINCYGKYCWMVRGGLISKCCYPLMVYKLNEIYNTNFKVDKTDCLKLSEFKDGWDIVEKLSKPIAFCKYCSYTSVDYKWEGFIKDPLISDFVKKEK